MIDLQSRKRFAEEQKLKKLIDGFQKSVIPDVPLGKDEDFLKTMKYIAKRLDFLIILQIKMLEYAKKKK